MYFMQKSPRQCGSELCDCYECWRELELSSALTGREYLAQSPVPVCTGAPVLHHVTSS